MKLETARARELFLREAPHVAHNFRFLEVVDFSEADVLAIIEEMGAAPPHNGRSGFTALWRDGAARLYEGQPQAVYLANWLGSLETSELYRPIVGKTARKHLASQDNVRVIGYFSDFRGSRFETFLRVAKHFQLDIEFAATTEATSAKFFKLRYPGDVAILKPSELPIVWSRVQAEQAILEDDESDDGEEDEASDKLPEWNYESLDQFVQKNRKALWSEIQITSMFSHWFSTNPKILLVVYSREALTTNPCTATSFTNWKNLAKSYARTVGLEFLLVDASIFSNVPEAIQVSKEELPVVVAFRDSKKISEHIFRIDKDDSPKEAFQKMKAFLDEYLALPAE